MRARDVLEESYPSIEVTAPAVDAARSIGTERRPAVLVVEHGRPFTVLPGSQVLRFLIPGYLQDDPSLVHQYDEEDADRCADRLAGKTVRDLLPKERAELPEVDPDATLMECAAVMARLRSPVAVVVDGDEVLGVVTAAHVLQTLVG
jgi:predicted transcriptional regulator